MLDVIVAVGFVVRWPVAYAAFYVAATSQMVLYTVFRGWIIDVPSEYTVSPEQVSYLTALVIFHGVTLALVTGALKVTHDH